MSDDYYSYRARTRLDRPVALLGFPGCRPRQTGRVAGMITGLETVMLPEQVAHHTERHVEALLLKGEHGLLHAAELHLLERAGRKRSPCLIALGPTTAEDPACRAWLVTNCRIVHLRQTLREAVDSIAADVERDIRKHQHLRLEGGIDEASLARLFSLRTALFERLATDTVEVAGRAPLVVGRQLPDVLGWTIS